MPQSRITYFFLLFATVTLGLLSRHFGAIPLFIGDILWALMVYFIVRFMFINRQLSFAVVISFIFSYAIEFSQLYQAARINEIRRSWLGHMVLGAGFLCSDLLCYTAGVALGVLFDKKMGPARFSSPNVMQ